MTELPSSTLINSFFLSQSQEYLSKYGSQTAEPQRIAATESIHSSVDGDEASPVPTSKSVRKYLGSRSPSGQSPVTKSRKTPQLPNISTASKETSEKEIGSPKSRTWKGLVARQFRKIQGQPSSPNSNFVQLPDGASIGVPLAQCPMVSNMIIFAECEQIIHRLFNVFPIVGRKRIRTIYCDEVYTNS